MAEWLRLPKQERMERFSKRVFYGLPKQSSLGNGTSLSTDYQQRPTQEENDKEVTVGMLVRYITWEKNCLYIKCRFPPHYYI